MSIVSAQSSRMGSSSSSSDGRRTPAPPATGGTREAVLPVADVADVLDAVQSGRMFEVSGETAAQLAQLRRELEERAKTAGIALEFREHAGRLAVRQAGRGARQARSLDDYAIAPGKEPLYDLFAQICHARDLETRHGLPSLEKLSVASGLGKGTLSNIIRTPYVPKAETLNKVSAFAGWDEDLLLRAAGLRNAPTHSTLSPEEELILDAFRGYDRSSIDYALRLARLALQYAADAAPVPDPRPAASPASPAAGRRTGAPAPDARPAE